MNKVPFALWFSLGYWRRVWEIRRAMNQIKRLEQENELLVKKIVYIQSLIPESRSVVYIDAQQRIKFYMNEMAKNDATIDRLHERFLNE